MCTSDVERQESENQEPANVASLLNVASSARL